MSHAKPLVTIEIQKAVPEASDHELETKNPQELLVASIVNGASIQHCSGILLEREFSVPMNQLDCSKPEHFANILEQEHFCLEIPTESMTSSVMTEKLLKVPPKERSRMLAKIMYENHISRVIIVAPSHICV